MPSTCFRMAKSDEACNPPKQGGMMNFSQGEPLLCGSGLMGRSQRIGQDDVRFLLRIVGELHELHSDPLAQGEHLITRL